MDKKEETITTVVDALVSLVRNRGRISFEETAKSLNISLKTVESWATFLEEEGELAVEYKFTTPFLVNRTPLAQQIDQDASMSENLTSLTQLIEQAEGHVADNKFSAAEKIYSYIITVVTNIFRQIQKERQEEKPFEDKDIEFRIAEIANKIAEAMDNSERKDVDKARKGYDIAMERTHDLHDKLQELSGILPSGQPKPGSKFKDKTPEKDYEHITEVDILLKDAYENMRAANFETAQKIYARINRIYDHLPKDYQEKKSTLKHDIVKLNRDLAVNLKENYRIQIKDAMKRTDELVHLLGRSLSREDFETGEAIIKNMNRLYNRLPEGFLEERIIIREKILKTHENFIEVKKEAMKKKTIMMEGEIKTLIVSLDQALKSKSYPVAEQQYQKVHDLFKRMPSGFMLEEDRLEDLLIDRYRILLRLKEDTKKTALKQISKKIESFIKDSHSQLGKKLDLEAAVKFYNEAKKSYQTLPSGFLEDTSRIQESILRLNEEILLKQREYHKSDFGIKSERIGVMLKKIVQYLKDNHLDLANELFLEIEHLFNALPQGFLHEKTKIHNNIINVYKDMMVKSDWSILEHETTDVRQKYNDLIRLIIQIHTHLEQREFHLIQPNYAFIIKIFDELPHGFVMKNIRIRTEIDKIGSMSRLYSILSEHHKNRRRPSSPASLNEARQLILLLEKESPQADPLIKECRYSLFSEQPQGVQELSQMTMLSAHLLPVQRHRPVPPSHEHHMEALKDLFREHFDKKDRQGIFRSLEDIGHESQARDLHLKAILVQKGRDAARLLRGRDILGAMRKMEEILRIDPQHKKAHVLKDKLENISLRMLPKGEKIESSEPHQRVQSPQAEEERYHNVLGDALKLIRDRKLDDAMDKLENARTLKPNPNIDRIIMNLEKTMKRPA